MAIPGLLIGYTESITTLPSQYSLSIPAKTGIVSDLPTVLRTYLMVAEPYDSTNLNLIRWSDDPTNNAWEKAAEISFVLGKSDPFGGTSAWEAIDTSTLTSRWVGTSYGVGDGLRKLAARVWVKAGTDTDVSLYMRNTTLALMENVTATKLRGPGDISGSTAVQVVLTGLSASEWTLVEYVMDNLTTSGQTYSLYAYPGGVEDTTANVSNIFFRPQLQWSLGSPSTSEVRKTESLTGPEGAPGQPVTLYLSNNGYSSKASDRLPDDLSPLPHQHFTWGLKRPYNAASHMFASGRLHGHALPAFGDIEIANPDGTHDELLQYSWSNRRIRIYFGEWTDKLEDFALLFDGTVEGIRWDLRTVSLQLRSKQFKLNRLVQSSLFGGFGSALRLNGTSQYVSVGRHPATLTYGSMTVSAMFRWFSKPSITTGHYVAAFSGATDSEADNALWALAWAQSTEKFFHFHEYGAGTNDVVTFNGYTTAGLYDGKWHHVACTRNSVTKSVKLYIDGKKVDEGTYVNHPTGGQNGELNIASLFTITSEWEGDLDEIRVWNVEKTAEQIDAARSGQLTGDESNLLAYYRLNEGTGSTTFDEVSLSAVGKKLDDLVLMDFTNDYVSVANNAAFQVGEMTIRVVVFPYRDPVANVTAQTAWERQNASVIDWQTVTGNLRVGIHNGTVFTDFTVPALAWARKWYYLDVTWSDTTKELKVYNKGVLIASTTHSGLTINKATGTIRMGANIPGTAFAGMWVAEAAFFNAVRSADDIASDWNVQLSGTEDNLVSYWKYNEGTGTTVADSVSSFNGTINGGAVWVNTDGAVIGSPSWIGTGEGWTDVAGKPKPIVVGYRQHVPLIPVDPLNLVYFAAEGPLEDIVKVFEGGHEKTDAGNLADVYTWTPVAGQYVTSNVHGLVRFGSAPSLPVTAHVKGDNSSTGYVDDAASIVRRLATRRGGVVDPDEVNVLSFQTLELAAPQQCGVYIGLEPQGLIETMSDVMKSVHGTWTFTRGGELKVIQLADPESLVSVITLDENAIEVGQLERHITEEPNWRWRVGYGRFEKALEVDQISASVTDQKVKAELQRELRYAVSENPMTKIGYLSSDDLEIVTALVLEKDAATEAAARMLLYGKQRHFYKASLVSGLFQYDLGTVVMLKVDRFSLDNGKRMMVVGWEEDVSTNRVSLTLWG